MKIHEINAIKIRKQVPSQHVILATRIRESFDFLSVSQTHHSPIKINKNNEIRFLNKVLSSFSARLYSPPPPPFFSSDFSSRLVSWLLCFFLHKREGSLKDFDGVYNKLSIVKLNIIIHAYFSFCILIYYTFTHLFTLSLETIYDCYFPFVFFLVSGAMIRSSQTATLSDKLFSASPSFVFVNSFLIL